MKYTLTLFILFINLILHSQSIENLDNKNGFRNIKLGDPYSKYQTFANNLNVKNNKVKDISYDISDNIFTTNIIIKDVSLTFYENKLYSITLRLVGENDLLTESQYNLALYMLEMAYGKDWDQVEPRNYFLKTAKWTAKKVHLEFYLIDFRKDNDDPLNIPTFGYLHFYDVYLNKLANNSFL